MIVQQQYNEQRKIDDNEKNLLSDDELTDKN